MDGGCFFVVEGCVGETRYYLKSFIYFVSLAFTVAPSSSTTACAIALVLPMVISVVINAGDSGSENLGFRVYGQDQVYVIDVFTLLCGYVCCRKWAALVSFSDVFTLLCEYVCCRHWAALVSFDAVVEAILFATVSIGIAVSCTTTEHINLPKTTKRDGRTRTSTSNVDRWRTVAIHNSRSKN